MSEVQIAQHLGDLPLRAILAFAARSARRVRPLAELAGRPYLPYIDNALRGADEFATGDETVAHKLQPMVSPDVEAKLTASGASSAVISATMAALNAGIAARKASGRAPKEDAAISVALRSFARADQRKWASRPRPSTRSPEAAAEAQRQADLAIQRSADRTLRNNFGRDGVANEVVEHAAKAFTYARSALEERAMTVDANGDEIDRAARHDIDRLKDAATRVFSMVGQAHRRV